MGWSEQNVTYRPDAYLKSVVPIGLFGAGTLATGNAVYMYLSVAFIQMLKAGTPATTMVVMVLFGLETVRKDLSVAVGVICLGCAMSAVGELHFSTIGFLLMMASEVFESLKCVLTQVLLDKKFSGPIEGLYHICPITFVCLIVLAAPFELGTFVESEAYNIMLASPRYFLFSGLGGFACNLLTMGVIKRANSLTFKILGQAKNVAVVCMGAIFLGESVTPIQTVAYIISIAGFFLYQQAMANKTDNSVHIKASVQLLPLAKVDTDRP
ncbi:hypothetical protein, variant [Sphaeroforma arctica JP610]|nr:hypothetical protein, variant [Sphaeroforma arctica JP610]KNC77693.1 hypothetical protein, variant [Sphaeroforma arctica JP610]|eukprot:XP_014151595.1 hypothetical protein, variant [Sphaeroforma arctica JP610]